MKNNSSLPQNNPRLLSLKKSSKDSAILVEAIMKKDDFGEFEQTLDEVKEFLQKAFPESSSEYTKILSALLTLPQSIMRMEQAQWELKRAHKDLVDVLDFVTDQVGTSSDKFTDKDFKKLCLKLFHINSTFTRLAGQIARGDKGIKRD